MMRVAAERWNPAFRSPGAVLPQAVAAIWALSMATPLAAHPPYLADSALCRLAGDITITTIHGDGLFGPDPVALVAVDAGGHVLGYHDVAVSFTMFRRHSCAFADWRGRVLLVPDPAQFRPGPKIVGGDAEAWESRWTFEPNLRAGSHGFETQPLTGLVWVEAFMRYILWQWQDYLVVLVTALGLGGVLGGFALGYRRHAGWVILGQVVLALIGVPAGLLVFVGFVFGSASPLAVAMVAGLGLLIVALIVIRLRLGLRARGDPG